MRRMLLCACIILFATSLAFAELISLSNPGFESGDFSGWTQSGNTGFTAVTNTGCHSGSYCAGFGAIGSLGYISQAITTSPGSAYDVTFYVQGSGTPNQVALHWDGDLVATWTDINIASWGTFGWSGLVASTASTELMLGFRDDPAFLLVDDVAVNEAGIPEPSTLWLCGAGALLLLLRRRK